MFIPLAMLIGVVVYAVIFNKDLNKEDIEKTIPFLSLIGGIILLYIILASIPKA